MRIFWDTNLFIYLWEGSVQRQQDIDLFASFMERENLSLVTSTLSLAEILVHPARSKQPELLDRYVARFRSIDLVPFDVDAAVAFAKIRAEHPWVKPPDAIQLATAEVSACEYFVSNDARLAEVSCPLRVIALSDWRTIADG